VCCLKARNGSLLSQLPRCPEEGFDGAIADGHGQVLDLGLVPWVGEASEQLVVGAHGSCACAVEVGGDSGADEDSDEVRGGLLARGAAERSQPPRLLAVAGLGGGVGAGVAGGQDEVPGEASDDSGGEPGTFGGEEAVQDPILERGLGVLLLLLLTQLVLVRGDGAEDAGGEGLGEGGRGRGDGLGDRELGELEQAPWDLVGVGAEEFGEVGTDLGDGVGEGEGGDDTAAVVAVEAVQAVPGGGRGGGQ